MPKNNEGHIVKVSSVKLFGGYLVSCKTCGPIGRFATKEIANKKKNDHRRTGGGPGWLGF
jgi:hypothetical protein